MTTISRQLPSDLYSAEQVRAVDRNAIDRHGLNGYELMQRAAQAAFECLQNFLGATDKLQTHILVACGGGNNGGDGYVIARYALTTGYRVHVVALVPIEELQGDALTAARHWRQCGGRTLQLQDIVGDQPFSKYALIVDALLGTGLQRPVTGDFKHAIETIDASDVPVLAVDIPSGLSANTGRAMGIAVKADLTISFIGLKRGLFTADAPNHCGQIKFADLDVPDEAFDGILAESQLMSESCVADLPQRRRDAHKGHCGHVLVIGGAAGMMGAAQMAAMAALRVGAGLVSVATAAEHAAELNSRQVEVMSHAVAHPKALRPLLANASTLVLGPGLGQSKWAESLLEAALDANLPTVIDADALNILAGKKSALHAQCVMTPHPGEAARLLGQTVAEVQADRFAAVEALCEQYQALCVLKGAGSLIKAPDMGVIAVCNRGHPGMATAGMGDILSGMIAGLMAQHLERIAATQAAVWLHAVAAEQLAVGSGRGMVATDLLPVVKQLVK